MRKLPFPTAWIGGDLREYRECDSTYCRYEYRSLPPLPIEQFDGSFSWLRRHPSPLEYDERFSKGWGGDGRALWNNQASRNSPLLIAEAQKLGCVLPKAFIGFLADFDLVSMFRSPSDCAGSFEEFVYRLWIENEIWFRLDKQDQPLTDEMKAYLEASLDTKKII